MTMRIDVRISCDDASDCSEHTNGSLFVKFDEDGRVVAAESVELYGGWEERNNEWFCPKHAKEETPNPGYIPPENVMAGRIIELLEERNELRKTIQELTDEKAKGTRC